VLFVVRSRLKSLPTARIVGCALNAKMPAMSAYETLAEAVA
jgi:hypothetical protein